MTSDTLGQFIETCCDIADGLSAPCAKLLKAYNEWADEEGVDKSYNKLTFAPALEAKGYPKSERGGTGYHYMGLTLKPDESVIKREQARYGN